MGRTGLNSEELRRIIRKALENFPDFAPESDPVATSGGWRIDIKRVHQAYGTFADTDKLRQVQRDLLYQVRRAGFIASLGREDRDNFTLLARPQPQDDELRTQGGE